MAEELPPSAVGVDQPSEQRCLSLLAKDDRLGE